MEKALINKIINFSNVDGPGNRLVIFFQGCPFKCLYCHNPETINLCLNCGECVTHCPRKALKIINKKVIWDDKSCINCDTCIKVCKHLSSPKVKYYSVEELVEHIQKVRPFIRGITVSGGECTNYKDFILELFKEAKKLGLTCLLDSNGCYDYENMQDLMEISDGVMLDVKSYSNDFHKEIIGKSNEVVISNLNYLLNKNKLEEVRTVILPNEDDNNYFTVDNVSKIIKDKSRYKLIKYRYFGVRKEGVDRFGKVVVTDKYIEKYKELAVKNGCNDVVIR